MKKILSVLLCACLCLSCVLTAFADTENQLTVDSYKQWLSLSANSYSESGTEYAEMLSAFTALTNHQQELFVTYLNDDELMCEISEAFVNGGNYTFADGNISITDDEVTTQQGTLANNSIEVAHERSMVFFEVEVVKVKNYIRYNYTETKVTGVIKGGILTVKNYVPGSQISYSNKSAYYTSKRAYHTADLSVNFVHKNLGLVMGSAEYGVSGGIDPKNDADFWVTKY